MKIKNGLFIWLLLLCSAICMMPHVQKKMVQAEERDIKFEEGAFTYQVLEDGTLSQWHYDWYKFEKEGTTNYKFPETVNGKKVTAVGNSAFMECGQITSVTIPEGVTSIGRNAFQTCKNLKKVTIPSSVTEIGPYAFAGSGIEEVIIPEGVTVIDRSVFLGCKKLEKVVIPDSVTLIGSEAFRGCEKLKEVSFPKGLKGIGQWAF